MWWKHTDTNHPWLWDYGECMLLFLDSGTLRLGRHCNPAGRQNDVVLGEGGYKFNFFTSSSSLGFIGVGEEEGSFALSLSLCPHRSSSALSLSILTGVPLLFSVSSPEFLCPLSLSLLEFLCSLSLFDGMIVFGNSYPQTDLCVLDMNTTQSIILVYLSLFFYVQFVK